MTTALLVSTCAVTWFCCLALLAPGDVRTRIHLLGPPAILGALLLGVALLLAEGFNNNAFKVVATCAVLTVYNPILSHALARADAYRRRAR